MPGTRCYVAACGNSLEKTRHTNKNISYHRFPKDEAIRKLWVEKCNRNGKWNPNTCHVCSLHFRKDDVKRDYRAELLSVPYRRKLKNNAVPILFLEDVNKLFFENIKPSLPSHQLYQHIKLDAQNIVNGNRTVYLGDIEKGENSLESCDKRKRNFCLDLVNTTGGDFDNTSSSYVVQSYSTSRSRDAVKSNAKSLIFNSCNLMKEALMVEYELHRRERNVKKLECKIKMLESRLRRTIGQSLKLARRFLLCKQRKGNTQQVLCS